VSIVASGGMEYLRELQRFLSDRDLLARIVAPPDGGPKG